MRGSFDRACDSQVVDCTVWAVRKYNGLCDLWVDVVGVKCL